VVLLPALGGNLPYCDCFKIFYEKRKERNVISLTDPKVRQQERERLEKERRGTLKDIQMWTVLHPQDFAHTSYLIERLREIHESLDYITNFEAVYCD